MNLRDGSVGRGKEEDGITGPEMSNKLYLHWIIHFHLCGRVRERERAKSRKILQVVL